MAKSTMEEVSTITVSVVEDDPEIREHLGWLLSGEGGVRCVSSHGSAEDALRLLPTLAPQVVLMDINLPGMTGIECIPRLKSILPATQVIMLTVHEDSDSIFQALQSGATGYLLKRAPSTEILAAIREIVRGGAPMTSNIARKVVQFVSGWSKAAPELGALTARETEVLQLLAKGYLYKEIASELSIQVNTVQNHIRAIYEKLHVHTRTDAVLKYLQK